MTLEKLKCVNCGTPVYRTTGRANEAKKFGWLTYCSHTCQAEKHNTQKQGQCSNQKCRKVFFRPLHQIEKSKNLYCSQSCAAIINNSKFPKKEKLLIKNECDYCNGRFFKKGRYCSLTCKHNGQFINKESILKEILTFYRKHRRVPMKRELRYNAARNRFGSWNNAVKAAGLSPNPVMFAEKHIAKDGHRCDSLTEKIIDDWFMSNKILHKRNISYPTKPKLTCDFVVKNYFIEFFGLENEHKRYTELVAEKRKLAKQYGLNLIEIKPAHIFPKNRLGEVLKFIKK